MNGYYSKIAGEDDALNAFGLAHGTPRPPPSWAQEWLEGPRKNGTKHLTIPSMREKKAFDPISMTALGLGAKAALPVIGGWLGHAALGGTASHVGGNIVNKLLRRFKPQLAQRQMASGIQHGLEGKQMHPVMQRLINRGLGPEYMAPYETGQHIAKSTASLTPEQRAGALRTSGNMLKETDHLSKAPIVGAIPGALDLNAKKPGFFHRLLPTAKAGVKFEDLPAWQRAIPTAMGAPLVALDPAMAGHFAINTLRDRVARSDTGRKFMANQLAEGARGKELHPLKKGLLEYGISPAISDPRNIGLAINKEYGGAEQKMNKWLADRGHNPVSLPEANDVVDYAQNVHNRLSAKPAAPAPVAAPPQESGSGGGLTAALLAGGGLYALNNRMRRDEDQR